MLPRHALLVLCVAATLSYCRGVRQTGKIQDYDEEEESLGHSTNVGRVPDYDEEYDSQDQPTRYRRKTSRDLISDLSSAHAVDEGQLPEDDPEDEFWGAAAGVDYEPRKEKDDEYDEIVEPDPSHVDQVAKRTFIKDESILSPEDRFRITRECLDKPVSESPWVTQVEGFCGEITCVISETVQSKAARFNIKICPSTVEERVVVINAAYPECCGEPEDKFPIPVQSRAFRYDYDQPPMNGFKILRERNKKGRHHG